MLEKKYQYVTFDKKGNELRFDMTELQHVLKDQLLNHAIYDFNQIMEILKLSDEQVKEVLFNNERFTTFKNELRLI